MRCIKCCTITAPGTRHRASRDYDCHFFDAGTVVSASRIDGVHLDAEQHDVLGRALAGAAALWLTTRA
jgi:hypothetical protein